RLIGGERLDPALRLVDRSLEVLRPLAGIDERLVEGGAVLVERIDLLAELRLALLGKRDVAGDRIELGFARLPGKLRRARLVRRKRPRAAEGNDAQREQGDGYPFDDRLDQIGGPGRTRSRSLRRP